MQCTEAKIRVSIASFLLGPRETVEPRLELVDDDHPRWYVPTTYEDYRKLRLSTELQNVRKSWTLNYVTVMLTLNIGNERICNGSCLLLLNLCLLVTVIR
ncbi:hypothetical protein HanPI659440_Chr16g0657681 [Helianthus annuus]|nr:hypothetical protein HanPI659440_Chr16g0657681 [Helianthus annuus]